MISNKEKSNLSEWMLVLNESIKNIDLSMQDVVNTMDGDYEMFTNKINMLELQIKLQQIQIINLKRTCDSLLLKVYKQEE